VVGILLASLRDCFEGRSDVAGDEAAVGGEREPPVWPGAQEGGAGDVFELADLPGEAGGRGAELAGGVPEVGLSGDREEPADALSGAGGVGVRAGRGDAGAQPGGGSQVTGSLMPAWDSSVLACRRRHRSSWPGMVNTNAA
jgi:hypothetical protein